MKEFNTKYINAYTLLSDLLYNWWVIFLAGVIGFSGFLIYNSVFVVEKFTSTTTVAVNLSGYTEEATINSMSRTIKITEAFRNVLQSSALVDIVEQEIGDTVTGTISATQRADTNLIDISVTDISPEKAYKTLKSVYNNYTVITDSAFSNILTSMITPPTMAEKADIRVALKNAIAMAFTCAFICIALILVFSYFRDTVKNISDVESLLDCKLFGVIHHINKKNRKVKKTLIGLMMTNPLIDYKFSNSFREMAVKLLSLQRTKNIKSAMITSMAENEGKTTVSINLALALAETGKKVILVDCDFKLPSVYKFFQHCPIGEKQELVDYIKGTSDYESVIRFDKRSGIYLAGGQKKYRHSSEIVSNDRFKQFISLAEEDFDFVIVDTPPSGVAVDSEIILENTGSMLLVVRQDYVNVEQINDFVSNINQSKQLGCVFNDVSTLRATYTSEPTNGYYV